MKRWIRFAAVLGVVLMLFGVIGGFIVDFSHPLMLAHILVGLALIVVGLILGRTTEGSLAPGLLTKRGTKFGFNAVFYAVVFVGLLVGLNWFGYSGRYLIRWDVTQEGVNSLSSQTTKVLDSLQKPLKIVAFTKGNPQFERNNDVLKLYSNYSSKVSQSIENPSAKPHLVEKYHMSPGNLVYIQYGDDKDIEGQVRIEELTEEALTNAILKLTRGAARKIYYVQGHGEPELQSEAADGVKMLAQAISDEHMNVEPILLAQKGAIPDDAAAVLLVSPKKSLLKEEIDLLKNYANGGGRLLMFTDPNRPSDVAQLSADFGIEVGNDVIIDKVQRLFAGPALGAQPVVADYGQHAITQSFADNTITIYNIASSVQKSAQASKDPSVTYTDLAKTSSSSWAEKDVVGVFDPNNGRAEKAADDIAGPVSIAVVYEKRLSAGKAEEDAHDHEEEQDHGKADNGKSSRVVVFGDSDWILNANINVYANRDFVLNTISWLAGEENSISIRPKSFKVSVAPIPESTFLIILSLSFLIPELLLVFGLMIWWNRRTVAA